MRTQITQATRLHLLRLNPGDDVLLSLREFVRSNQIQSGVFLTGIGSLSRYHVHVVKTTALPPGDVFFEGAGALDILAITGYVLEGRVHAHITFSDTEKAMGGHLEEGCRVLTFCLVTLAEVGEVDMTSWDTVGPL